LSVEEILDKIQEFFRAQYNVILDKVKFHKTIQHDNQRFEDFYISECLEDQIKVKIIVGLRDEDTRIKLMAIPEDDYTLQRVVDICRAEETASNDDRRLGNAETFNVQKSAFVWSAEHDKAFEDVKAAMSDLPRKTPYDPELETVVETDAAKKRGFGYILKQRGKGGCWRLIETNSRQLVPIMNSKMLDAIKNPRQREIKERMQLRYNFTCKWIPGKDMYASDALS
ncbi:hypothetical protein TCAL_16345, partial [Tigriopus californicus]